jgi:hypothetical protein
MPRRMRILVLAHLVLVACGGPSPAGRITRSRGWPRRPRADAAGVSGECPLRGAVQCGILGAAVRPSDLAIPLGRRWPVLDPAHARFLCGCSGCRRADHCAAAAGAVNHRISRHVGDDRVVLRHGNPVRRRVVNGSFVEFTPDSSEFRDWETKADLFGPRYRSPVTWTQRQPFRKRSSR